MGVWRPNFSWVADDLAVGGSFPVETAASLAAIHGFGAVIDLREEACDDCQALFRHGIEFLHLPTVDLGPVSQPALDSGVAFARRMNAEGRKLLIHCEHGIGRSALLALCVLVDRGIAPMEALRSMKDRRRQVSPSPSQFEAWEGWLVGRGLAPPDFEAFRAVAYSHLASA